jgi:hypothetical protein
MIPPEIFLPFPATGEPARRREDKLNRSPKMAGLTDQL